MMNGPVSQENLDGLTIYKKMGHSGGAMLVRAGVVEQDIARATSAHVVVVGNEKGGSGKSTTSMHIAVALLKAGQRVATIDLDARQGSFSHYIDNRRAWA